MTLSSADIRRQFLDFFSSKQHTILPSAPMVNKDDPTLMFTNAGMNQFKDYFLGNKPITKPRIADTQKCLRVSGKHNDLEEVGRDSYHHTMFEMLGNWSFGDYFKKEAITWAWELLVDIYGLDPSRIYVTVFGGDEADGTQADTEAEELWLPFLPKERILRFDKKDNFWEMGDTGPCGPCSEIHYDLRDAEARSAGDGATLVNQDDPLVVELWNLVFIQYNRMADGQLESLPAKHVDTGMGFERITMALQGKTSNYDTDVFSDMIQRIAKDAGIQYTGSYAPDAYTDIAMRVIADHIRAGAFAIADGAIPSNTGAGYVIRRILRRAIRYAFSYLDIKTPYLHQLLPQVVAYYDGTFPELDAQADFIAKIILEEEKSFLQTLDRGLTKLADLQPEDGVLDGAYAFELYDTYGFPLDLTRLIAEERGWSVDEMGFEAALAAQKQRSKKDAAKEVGDWHILEDVEATFVGYDQDQLSGARITKYRSVKTKKGLAYQVVLQQTPFYPEGGGQVGDTGTMQIGDDLLVVKNTYRENELIIHEVDRLPSVMDAAVVASIDDQRRRRIEANHSVTHLLHAALREVLGDHVQQKGSLVAPTHLRFDFSHHSKVSDEELRQIEGIVQARIRQNIALQEDRSIALEAAKEAGAMMLFGEKYGDTVRMITFDASYSRELCGGCHVPATGRIGAFKLTTETAVASGIRRVEALTGAAAEDFINEKIDLLSTIASKIKQQDLVKGIDLLLEERNELAKTIEAFEQERLGTLRAQLISAAAQTEGRQVIIADVGSLDAKQLKLLAHQIEQQLGSVLIALGGAKDGKPSLLVHMDKATATETGHHAGQLVKDAAKHIRGGGGGQPHSATAGGSHPDGLADAMDHLRKALT